MNPIRELENYVSTKLSIGSTTISIIKLEAQLAGLSLIPFLLSLGMLFIVLMTLWLTVMVLFGYFFAWIFGNLLLGFLSVFLLNLGLSCLVLCILIYHLKNMSFQKTRDLLLSTEEES